MGPRIAIVVRTDIDDLVGSLHAILLEDLFASARDAWGIASVPSCVSMHLNTDTFIRYLHYWLLGLFETDTIKKLAYFDDILLGEGDFDGVDWRHKDWVEITSQ